jgi:hypothetical protein
MTDFDAEVNELYADLGGAMSVFIKSRGGSVQADVLASAIWRLLVKFLLMAPDHDTCKLGIETMREELQALSDEVERRRVQPEAALQ